jgi:hypothetical protein
MSRKAIRGNPIDGVVLLLGCDKTTPSLLMGAASVDLPTIGVSGGPMLNGKWRGQELGSGTGVWSMSEQVRAGTLKLADFLEAESCMHRSHGHCMTMGTASTMASMVEALGIGLPGNAAYPAVDGRRNVLARNCRPAHRGDGARRPEAVQRAHAPSLRERHPHAGGHRRQHQCGDPPDRHRRPHGRAADGGRLRPPGQRDCPAW